MSLHDQAIAIATAHAIAPEGLLNLVESESKWNPDAVGDHDCSFGLAQINVCAHPSVTREQALDPDFSLNWTATKIAEGNGWWWVSGNCYSFVLLRVPNLPHMADIQKNTDIPHKGEVAIFYYHDKTTGKMEKHIAYVTATDGYHTTIAEANKEAYVIDSRVISPDSVGFAGFFDPNAV